MNFHKEGLVAFALLGSVFIADAQTAKKQLRVTETVSAHDPFEGQSLRDATTVKSQRYEPSKWSDDPNLPEPLNDPARVRYIDRDKNPSTFERVVVDHAENVRSDNKRISYSLPVRAINDYKIYLAGHNMGIDRVLGTTHVVLGEKNADINHSRYIAREDILNDLLAFSKSPANKAFPVKEVEMVIYPMRNSDGFTLEMPDTSWMQKTSRVKINYGQRVFGVGNVKTRFGNHRVTFYSNDGNPDKYEVVLVERNGGFRCKVNRLIEIKLGFITDDWEQDTAVVKCIELYDPNNGYFKIVDDVLYNSLMTLKDDTVNNKALDFSNGNCWLFLDEGGIYSSYTRQADDGYEKIDISQ